VLLSGKYGYDPGGQLTGAAYEVANPTVPNVPNDAFAYDNAGNRTTVNGTSYTLNSAGLNQYAAAGSYGAASYDARGNLVALGVGASAIYDAQNEMTSGSVNGNSVSFAYDALGRCVKRIVNGAASYFYYDGWSLIEEDNSAGAAQLLYVYGPATDELAAIYSASSSSWSWYHYDARGSVTHLTNASGQLVEQYTYSAFGIPSYFSSTAQPLNSSTVGNRFLFQGRDWIKELSLYDYRNRMYHPGIGRFLQPDPLSLDAGDQNIYRYCNNDPINYSDPLGLGYEFTFTINSGVDPSTSTLSLGDDPLGLGGGDALDSYYSFNTMPSSDSYSSTSDKYSGILAIAGFIKSILQIPHDILFAGATNEEGRASMNSLFELVTPPGALGQSSDEYANGFRAAVKSPQGQGYLVGSMAVAILAHKFPVIPEAAGAAKAASTELSVMRYTQKGETFLRYESTAFSSRITSSGGVTAQTFAAPISDGLVPLAQRSSTYNLFSPNVLRTEVFTLRPPAGTAIIGPRSVVGGTGKEVIFPVGF